MTQAGQMPGPAPDALSHFGWYARYARYARYEVENDRAFLASSMREGEPWRCTEDPEQAYQFATKREAVDAIEAYGLVDGDWFVVEYRDEARQQAGPSSCEAEKVARRRQLRDEDWSPSSVDWYERWLARHHYLGLHFSMEAGEELLDRLETVRRETIEACVRAVEECDSPKFDSIVSAIRRVSSPFTRKAGEP